MEVMSEHKTIVEDWHHRRACARLVAARRSRQCADDCTRLLEWSGELGGIPKMGKVRCRPILVNVICVTGWAQHSNLANHSHILISQDV
jgi:hypothetical protein